LLSSGASPFIQDRQGQTPLHIAARQNNKELVDLIMHHVVCNNSNGLLAKEHLLGIRDKKGRIANVPNSPLVLSDDMLDKTQRISSIGSTAYTSLNSLSSIESVCDSGSSPSIVQRQLRISANHASEVYRAHWRGTTVAVKQLGEGYKSEGFKKEIEIMMTLRHPNLVLLMGMNFKMNFMILEFCNGGTLFELIHRKQLVHLSWRQKIKMLLDISKGMNYLHTLSDPIIHRDLKSLNILLVEEIADEFDTPFAKISDFGLSVVDRRLGSDRNDCNNSSPENHMVGTYQWMAPEVIKNEPHSVKVDVYSFGIVMYEILSRTIPYGGNNWKTDELLKKVSNGGRPDLRLVDSSCPSELYDLMQSCWVQCPESRPSFDSVITALHDATTTGN
jgi:serine/threonine protein kinase